MADRLLTRAVLRVCPTCALGGRSTKDFIARRRQFFLKIRKETIEYTDGNDRYTRKRPGKVKYSNITMKRGMVTSPQLVQWFQESAKGKNIRKSISVIGTNRDGKEVRINLGEANLGTVESPLLCPHGLCFFDKPNAEYRWDKAYCLAEQGGLMVESLEIVVADLDRDGQLD